MTSAAKVYGGTSDLMILAHRGGAGEAPEHSLEAFQRAVEQGCDYLEADVRPGSDGELYLSHGGLRNLMSHLKLSELFEAFPDKFFALDPKQVSAIKPLAETIVRYGMENRVCIGASYDSRADRVASMVEALSGKRPATALVSAQASLALSHKLGALKSQRDKLQAAFIHINERLVSPRVIGEAHRHGLRLIAWTVNDTKKMRTFIEWGIDGFMTDYPTRAREVSGVQ